MKSFVLILLLNTFQGDGKAAIEKIEGFSSFSTCQEAGKVFEHEMWAQYYYCIEVK